MTRQKPDKPSFRRKIAVMERAYELRTAMFPDGKAIDPEQALDWLCGKLKGFDWFVGDEFFEGMNRVLAYAKFDNGRQVFLSDSVYSDLQAYGTIKYKKAAFVVAHEIGHVILHHRTRKTFARNELGSEENYRTESLREFEANIFAGSFMVPTSSIDVQLSDHTISQVYTTSYKVASEAKRAAAQLQKWKSQQEK